MTPFPRACLAAACAAALFAAPAFAQDKPGGLHQVMSKNMKEMQSMQMTGDVDRDFAMMMKHHHQSGIEMAQVQVREGKDPELKKQAQQIIDGQKKEMAELDRWMQSKGQAGTSAKGASSGHSGGSGSAGHGGHGQTK